MKKNKLIIFVLIISYVTASAQVMNVRKWRKTERDSLDNGMYLIEENAYLQALPIFENLLKDHPKEEFLRYTYAKTALYRSDKHEDAYTYLSELYEKNKKVPDIQYDMALAAHYTYRFDEATQYINQYVANKRTSAEGKKSAGLLMRYIGNAKVYYNKPTAAKLQNLGPNVNTAEDEYGPTITADESQLVFTYAGEKSVGGRQNQYMQPDPYGDYLEDIYVTQKKGEEFSKAMPLESLNTNLPDASVSMSHDGRILFMYQDIGDGHGDLYQSVLNGESFGNPVKLQGDVNSYSWDGHCCLSPDGKTIYFSSERGGGLGGRDLYKATLQPDSTWGTAVNMGDSINTAYDEDGPYMHPDGVTLYYSSKGRTSMGGYDVFRSVMNTEDSLFKRTENLGYPINSPADDIYFSVAADSKHGYYSSARRDGVGMRDIYRIETNFTEPSPGVYLVKGKATDGGRPVDALVKVEISSRGSKLFKSLYTNSANGSYLITLPAGAQYHLSFSYADRTTRDLDINAVDLKGYEERIFDFDFTPVADTQAVAAAPVKTVQAAPAQTVAAVTKSVVPEPTVAVTEKTVAPEPVVAVKEKTVAAVTPPVKPAPVVTKTASAVAALTRESYFPTNPMQEKTMRYAEKYGDIKANELEFRVQLAAVKTSRKYDFKNPQKLGKIEEMDLGDGYIRVTAGGTFKTLLAALNHNKQVAKYGQKDGFVMAIYQGKRVSYDYLEEVGVFK